MSVGQLAMNEKTVLRLTGSRLGGVEGQHVGRVVAAAVDVDPQDRGRLDRRGDGRDPDDRACRRRS